ncbi:MAG: two-component regulator propeller domain-containing protein [Chitinophagales bacterium]
MLFACLLFCIGEVFSQQLPFINYTPADGLVSNRVRSMYQDSKGRLYFLTYEGLSMYDGARFTNYGPAEGLTVDMVNDMLELSPDSLWVATNSNQFSSLVKGKIKPLKTADGFCPVINSFFKSRNGKIYVASDQGLFIWEDQKFRQLPFFYNGKEAGQFMLQIQEVDNFLLILINPGLSDDAGALFLYDPDQQKILYAEKKIIISGITTSANGDIWLCSNNGVRVLKKETLQQGRIITEDVPVLFTSIQNKKASFLKFDNQGQLWLSVYGEGLLLLKPGMAPVLYNEISGLSSAIISYIFQDKEGNNWFLPEGKGAQKLVSNNVEFFDHPFKKNFVNDLYTQTKSDSVWFYDGTKGQIILLNNEIKKTFRLPTPPMNRGHLLANGSSLWLYDEKRVYQINVPAAGDAVKTMLLYQDSSFQTGNGIIDPYGNIIYCADNLLKVLLKNKTIFSYPVDYFIDQPAFDKNGHLWIATRSNKLQVFTLHPEDPVHYLQLQSDFSDQIHLQNPRSLAVDDSGRIWIGTRYDGLYCFHYSSNRLTLLQHLTRKEGLSNNFINYINCDHNNDIWVSSPAGLDKLEMTPARLIIKNITQSNHLFLFLKKIMTDRYGTVWALGESGNLLKVYAPPKNNQSFTPLLYIAQIKSGSTFFSDADSIHSFSYRQNNLNFSVAVPSFYDEKQIKYSYLLTGSGNDVWSEPLENADLNFVNLAPGQYTLNVKAVFPESRYRSQLLSYSFVITPPWWQTWWFRLLAGLFIAALILLAVRNYYQRKLKEQRSALEKQQAVEKERMRIASDMHDDLGAGLSTLRFLSEKVKRNSFSEVTRQDADKIVTNSNELVQKMNEIIWAMNEKNDTLEHLVFYTRSYAMEYCEENQLDCDIQIPENIPHLFLSGEVRRNIFLTVKESLHNIVKHAEAKKVEIRFIVDKKLSVIIHDNGKGFSGTRNSNGGNGLRNLQKRIESAGGYFSVSDGEGVTIEATVPL